jgi:hypothetical protein
MVLVKEWSYSQSSDTLFMAEDERFSEHVLEATHAHVKSAKLLLLLMQQTKLRDI